MPTSPGSSASGTIGKVDRWIIGYLTFSAFVFSTTYIATYCYHWDGLVRYASMLLGAVLLQKILRLPPARGAFTGRATVIVSLLFVVALLNTLVSWDQEESFLRWIFWLGLVVCFTRVTGTSDGSWVEAAIQWLPFLFTFVYATIIVSGHYAPSDNSVKAAFHLSGLYGNLILATGLFSRNLWQRLLWTAIGLAGIFYSGAGGALFTIPIMFTPYILYSTSSMPVKGIAVAGILVFGGLFFFESQLFETFLDIKLNNATGDDGSYSGLDRLERSKEGRIELILYGIDLAEQHPLGTGLGHTYAEQISGDMGVSHVHNGTLTMIVELGFPSFAVVASLLLWIFATILRSRTIGDQTKAFYFTYFFTIFGRSLSENYTPFDLGNFFNIVFLIFTSYFFIYERSAQTARPTPGRPAFRTGRMLPPPRWAPPPPGARPPPRPLPVH